VIVTWRTPFERRTRATWPSSTGRLFLGNCGTRHS
jgi:hypothetical protein